MSRKLIILVLLVGILLVSGCGSLSAYGDDPFGDIGIETGLNDPVAFKVEYINNGAIITAVLNSENVLNTAGLLNYDSAKFNVGYKQVSNWLCKYNAENSKIACASTVPANTGDIFEFTVVAKDTTSPEKYSVSLSINEINSQPVNQELDILINVK